MPIRALAAALLVAFSAQAEANIDIQFDYSYDSSGFFSDASHQSALNAAASLFESRFSDQLTAITSSGPNSFNTVFFNPGDPAGTSIVNNDASFAANVIRVYAGGYNFTDNTLGEGGPGGYSCSGIGSFCNNAIQRGQGIVTGTGAVDVAPWGGSITFDEASPERSTVAFTIQAASIDTGTPDRDAHLRSQDFFHVEQHPAITFVSTAIRALSGDAFEVSGDLTMRGVTKRVTLPVTYLGKAKDPWGNEKIGFEAETAINRKDYGLTWNAALETGGFLVGDEVKVSVSIQAA